MLNSYANSNGLKMDLSYREIIDEEKPESPSTILYDSILAAKRRTTGLIQRTPCNLGHMSEKYGIEMYYKADNGHISGSLKDRGICNFLCMLSEEQKKIGVVSASIGNFGVSLAIQTSKWDIPCYLVMATCTANNKFAKCQEILGSNVILKGSTATEAVRHAKALANEKNMLFINGYEDPSIIEGQGICGIELIEQIPHADAVIVPVGSGGLITGISIACKHLSPNIKVYGVSTNKTFAMAEALKMNEIVTVSMEPSIADGLAVDRASDNAFHHIKNTVDNLVIVKEEWVMRAIAHLAEEEKMIVEGAGAVSVAAIMAGLFPQLINKTVICVLSGGNINFCKLARSVERSLSYDGRLVKFKLRLCDRRGSLADFVKIMSDFGMTIHDIVTERTYVTSDVLSMQLKVLAETNGLSCVKDLKEAIKKKFTDFYFQEDDPEPVSPASRRGPCLAPNPVCMQK